MKFLSFSQTKLGSSLSLPAYGREGQGQHIFSWRRISQSEIRNSAAEKSESESEGGQKFLPPTPFLFVRPSVQFMPRFARQSVGVSFKIGSSFVQSCTFALVRSVPPSPSFSRAAGNRTRTTRPPALRTTTIRQPVYPPNFLD